MDLLNNEIITFSALPGIIKAYADQIPLSDIDRRRGETAWTIREHLYHISLVQEMLLGRLMTIRENDEPVIEPYFPENERNIPALFRDMDDAMSHYARYRDKQVGFLDGCSDRDMRKSAVHKEYSRYSIPLLIRHMIFHEYWHMYRIEEIWLTKDCFWVK